MRVLACLPLLCATVLVANELADRAAIDRVIDVLSHRGEASAKDSARLFTHGAENELSRLPFERGPWSELPPSAGPWSEMTPPTLTVRTIRFVTPDVALVDASAAQYGSLIVVRRAPVLLVMRREGTDWKIASLRILSGVVRLGDGK